MLAVVLGALLLAVCCCLNKAGEVLLMHAYPSGCRGVKARNVHVSKSSMHMHIMPFIWHQVFPVARNQGPAAVARNQAPLAGIQAPLPQLRYALYVSFHSAWPLISMTDTLKFSPSGNLVQRWNGELHTSELFQMTDVASFRSCHQIKQSTTYLPYYSDYLLFSIFLCVFVFVLVYHELMWSDLPWFPDGL